MNEIQLLLVGANTFNTSDLLDINSLQYIDEFYIIHWNIKLNDHSLYYLTVSAIGTYGTSTSDHATEISKIYKINLISMNHFICRQT